MNAVFLRSCLFQITPLDNGITTTSMHLQVPEWEDPPWMKSQDSFQTLGGRPCIVWTHFVHARQCHIRRLWSNGFALTWWPRNCASESPQVITRCWSTSSWSGGQSKDLNPHWSDLRRARAADIELKFEKLNCHAFPGDRIMYVCFGHQLKSAT